MSSQDSSFSSTVAATNKNLSRLSKTVASTATTLMTSSYGDLTNTHYQSAMKDIARQPAYQKRLFAFNTRRAPSEFVKTSLSRSEIQYRAVTSIPEELLHNIPTADDNKFSLFQGFQATTEEISSQDKDIGTSSKLLKGKESSRIPSSQPLSVQRNIINHHLDILEIRKDLAANEIKEIDQRIAHLNSTRMIVFERIAELEQEELKLEAELEQLSIKLEKEENKDHAARVSSESGSSKLDSTSIGISTPKETSSDDNGWSDLAAESPSTQQASSTSPADRSFASNSQEEAVVVDSPLLSQSIYGKLQNETASTKKNRNIRRRNSLSRRKTMPTLQQFYAPGKNIRTIEAHSDSITAVDFDIPFGTMVSASIDDSVLVWDLSKGKAIRELDGHKASVKCLQMENNLVATGSADATVKLWDLTGGDEEPAVEEDDYIPNGDNCYVETFAAHVGEITALNFSDNTLVTGSADKTIRQWDIQTGRCLQTLDVLWASAQSSAASAFGGFDDTRWRRKTMVPGAGGEVSAEYDFVGALQCFDAALATGTADGIVRLWDLRTGQVHRSLLGHTGPVTCLQFDDVHLATGSLDRSIRIWDLRTGSIFDAFAYESPITSLHFDTRRIVSANSENTVKIYDREVERHWTCGAGEEDSTASVINSVRYREGYLIEGREDGKIGVWAC
ncbi:Mdv1p [Sugiyamaella lignohabitans]|uniref:Mdv1p n=1 Tax=Sugiyamaella lignohabitans TaxID=796027 RepID=A0A167CAW9_9ASCO|nr:Mdv1p [Sugiyamaella lignohabitans]ANB11445.1 Mdv1p [Sugiyamaella lignohabitans]